MGLDQNFVRLTGPDEDDREEVAYFRKVNFLHLWVEQHLNEGKETNCEQVPMHLEAIAGLAQTCTRVLMYPELGEELLPTVEGFFFGSTEYDNYYLADVESVLSACQEILEYEEHSDPPGSGRYVYWSWW